RAVQRHEPADDRPLVQRDAETVAELKAEALHLAREAELLRLRPKLRDLVRADARLDRVDGRIDPLARLLVGVTLLVVRAADVDRAVVARAIAHVGLDDVEERLIARADEPIGEV